MNHSGTISSNETWYAINNPHHITGSILISSGAVVTVEAGCEIYFDGNYLLWVTAGEFNIEGTEGNEVLITSNQITPSKGDWQYILDTPGNSTCNYAIIEYGGNGNSITLRQFGTVTNSIIRYCLFTAIDNINTINTTFQNNKIYDCYIGIYLRGLDSGKTLIIDHNLIYECSGHGVTSFSGADFYGTIDITNNAIIGTNNADNGLEFNNFDQNGTFNIYNNILTDHAKAIHLHDFEPTANIGWNCYYNNTIDIEGGSEITGSGSIYVDPEFIDADNDNYGIYLLSPCDGSGYGTPYEDYIGYIAPIQMSFEDEDSLTLSDEIKIQSRPERLELADTLRITDDLKWETEEQESADTTSLSDEIKLSLIEKKEEEDVIALSDELEISVSVDAFDTLNIGDEITIKEFSVTRTDIYNSFGMIGQVLSDVNNKISVVAEGISDITNDIRFLKSWQIAGDAGYQSLGKTYVKVYINNVEQTDTIIDSISISKFLNGSQTASFNLGRPYDNTKPNQESEVEIKYHTWTLYKGYITQIIPTNNPEEIKIACQDEYWKRNKTKKYFHVGHRPSDNFELYYNTIATALSTQFDWNPGIGSFVPQNMDCFGVGSSDCISNLIQNSGNYAWYYNYNKTKKLWIAGQGSIINLEKQEIGKNLGLYQVLNHFFGENIGNIVNKYRVQMGDWVWRRFSDSGASRKYPTYRYWTGQVAILPAWDSTYERLGKDSPDGYGVFFHPTPQNRYYDDVFTKYRLPFLDPELSSWTDRFPPTVEILIPFGSWLISYVKYKTEAERLLAGNLLTEGFTIDYENGYLIFNEPIYCYQLDENGDIEAIRKPDIRLLLSKKEYYSNTEDPSDDPTSDISNPLMFFTDKMGDYPETIMDNLELSNFSIQIGYHYKDAEGDWHTVPSWNDTLFAKDYADWQLSKICDKKINGTINLTLDTVCFYDIDLTKRIKIAGIMDTPLNIISMTYNIGSWRVSLNLQNNRYYKRTENLQSHGE